ncbi:MAG: FGGY family carbohydrate kinase [Synergistes sp.]|nr:FGGY family carbohydrate kinase [Synergistes sp.]
MKYYIAFDCGTMGTKTALYSVDSTLIAEAYRENKISYPLPGRAEMDANGFVENVRSGIRECLAKSAIDPADVRAVSASGIICGIVGIDKNWNPVTPFVSYLDNRAADEARFVRENVAPVWEEESGNIIVDEFMPPLILRWFLNEYTDFRKKAVKVVNNGPFVLGALAGLSARDAFLDWATMSGWLIGYDAIKRDWSPKQLDALGIPAEILPRIVKPWDIVGYLCKEEAEKMGLPAGIPIAAGAGDTMQSSLASGLWEPGLASDVAGTASIFAVAVEKPDRRITAANGMMFATGTLANSYFYWSMIRAGGLSLRWFRDNVANRAGDPAFYSEMDALASSVPAGSGGLLFYPYLQGAGPDVHGACGVFAGLTGASGRGEMWRSILEAIAFEYAQMIKIYRECGIPLKEIIGTEGGSKSAVWNQIKADILGGAYNIPSRSEGGLMADTAVAAYSVGDIKDIHTTMKEWTTYRARFEPNAHTAEIYRNIFAVRQKLLSVTMPDLFGSLDQIRKL